EISTHRVPKVDDVLKPGDKVLVMVKEIDDMGRVNLTRRRILENEQRIVAEGLGDVIESEKARDAAIAVLAATCKDEPRAPGRSRPPSHQDRGDRVERGDRRGAPRRHSSGGRE
ncbi:MAG TPA: polyribonucleotide nucleotidyltransferase, partial [Synergistaceae bacterium]|nr:polyribonucleotide nucleotidyltransferase [Synergistaceae bacterium]